MRSWLLLSVALASCGGATPEPVDEAALRVAIRREILAELRHQEEERTMLRARLPDPEVARVPVPVGGAPRLGPADAAVTIVVFSDFECPFCRRALPTLEALREAHPEDVALVFRSFPLAMHRHAYPAAAAAAEAYRQRGADGFWAMHDVLFETPDLGDGDLVAHAVGLGLDGEALRRAIARRPHPAVEVDMEVGRDVGVRGTPNFFLNGRSIRGAQPLDVFEAIVEEELALARLEELDGLPRGGVYARRMADAARAPSARPSAPSEHTGYTVPVPPRAPSVGSPNAPLTIQIFSDFQCPFCARVEPTVARLVQRYQGRVRWVWRDYPLPFHQRAMPAAEAAREVWTQAGDDAFAHYRALLYQNQRDLADDTLVALASQIPGVQPSDVRAALVDHRHRPAIEAGMTAVRRAGMRIGTPSFLIGDRLLQGAQPEQAFIDAIDEALRAP
jgi:protein-disulfide isomerase